MHFDPDDLPVYMGMQYSHQLNKDDIVIDEHGTPWIIKNTDEVVAVLNRDREVCAHRYRASQLVFREERLQNHTEVFLIDIPLGRVKFYHPGELVKRIMASRKKFDAKLAAL